MFLLTATGTTMIATSLVGIHRNLPNTRLKMLMNKYIECNKLEGVKVKNLSRDGETFKMELSLPYNITADEVQKHVPGIEQVTSSHVRFSYSGGPMVRLDFGFSEFRNNMKYKDGAYKALTIPLYTPFGVAYIDFNSETSCHMLIGGATRMGKTAFLRLVAVMLLHTTKGNVTLKMLDNKIMDLYMFRNIPQVEVGETEAEAEIILTEAYGEMERRKSILRRYDDCVDLKEFRVKHAAEAEGMEPFFVIIDEYGRFADNDRIQKAVERLVETAGYLDIHVIIASQRPDAQTVLKARIKANLTTRICFTTMDEVNSKVVLDISDAAKLNKIQGRAILLDGFPEVVQVPYLTTSEATALLKPYVKDVNKNDKSERCTDYPHVDTLQSFEPRPIGEDHIPEPKKRNRNRKPNTQKARS